MALCFKLIFVAFFIICVENNGASKSGLSKLLSVLGQRYGSNKQPIIVIVNSHSDLDRSRPKAIPKAVPSDSVDTDSDERIALHLSHILQHNKANKLLSAKKSTTPLPKLKHTKHNVHKVRDQDRNWRQWDDKKVLRSPIVKQLLRISNSIQCEAKDECQDKCTKFSGPVESNCQDKCEIKYDCDEEEPKDPCDEGECQDSCGNSNECSGSTKGEKLVTEKPTCIRC